MFKNTTLSPAPLRNLHRGYSSPASRSAFGPAMQRLLPGLLLKMGAALCALEFVPVYGLFLGDLFGSVTEGLSFALTRI